MVLADLVSRALTSQLECRLLWQLKCHKVRTPESPQRRESWRVKQSS